jgi:hypothetical protein
LAAAALTLAVPATGAPARPVACDTLVVSPTVMRDRTVFCVLTEPGQITVSSSNDLGRTWRTAVPTGFLDGDEQYFNGLVLSPTYSQDRLLFLQTKEALYASTDAAATLLPVDPAGGASTLMPSITALRRVLPVSPVPVPNGVLLAQAFQAAPPQLLHPPARWVAPGGPGLIETFLAAPPGDGPYAGTILAVGRDAPTMLTGGIPLRVQDAVYPCTPSLACPTRKGTFPPDDWVYDIRLSPDFARTGVVHAQTSLGPMIPTLWISRDGGGSFARLPSAQAIVDAAAHGEWALARVASDPRDPRRLYLRVSGKDSREAPREQIFRSDDDGRTWRRLGYWRPSASSYGRGVPGWPGPSHHGLRDSEPFEVLPNGSLVLTALAPDGGQRLYCSTDGARTWRVTC